MKSLEGVIVKGIGGFYYVDTSDGLIECRARGIFRKKGMSPLVGDEVVISTEDGKTGAVDEIKPRRNSLIRPAVANVTHMMAVVALESPKPNPYVLDKLIASAEFANLKISVCFNKSDLTADTSLAEVYTKAGLNTVIASAADNVNVDGLKVLLKDEITVFAGNSGVGKSSLLNRIMERDLFETGKISDKTERGRHTTRHSELVSLPFGGYIIDTPGFSSFELDMIPLEELSGLFREFKNHTTGCRFLDCRHISEPDCSVTAAIENGEISQVRHESYKQLYDEIKKAKQNQF